MNALQEPTCRQYYDRLRREKKNITAQQYSTIKGQLRAGDIEGAMRGLDKITRKGGTP